MNLFLLIHNIGFIISAFATLTALFFLLLNNPQSKGHLPLILTCVAVIVFIISHVLGVNTPDSEISRNILMLNLSNFFIGMFNVHAFLSFLGKEKKYKYFLIMIYITGISLVLFFILNPNLFLLSSVPKMYFPNYYVPGEFHWIRIAYLFGVCVVFMLYVLIDSYRHAENVYKKSQLKYLIIGFLIAYGVGYIPNFLVYGIELNPLYGMAFMLLFTMAFLYGAIKYELMNIKVIAKQASIYAFVIGFIGGSIIFLEYLNTNLTKAYPSFPFWAVPSFSILLLALVTLGVWRKIRQVDLMKYEFITTVTHKFRTPLTQIKWSVDNLSHVKFDEDEMEQVSNINTATDKLVELTNLLVSISEADNVTYKYQVEVVNFKKIVEETIFSLKEVVTRKKIILNVKIEDGIMVEVDRERVKFVIQTLIENALDYTPETGSIDVVGLIKNYKAFFSVKDSGIGIAEKEIPYIFSKFYRGDSARTIDTEGMGIGLFISKEIILRHDGKIWVESEGINKGSKFTFVLPLHK